MSRNHIIILSLITVFGVTSFVVFLNIFSENRKKLKQETNSPSVSVLQSSTSSQFSTLKSSSKNSFAGFSFDDQVSSSSKSSFAGFSFSDQASSSSSTQASSSIASSSTSSASSASSSVASSSLSSSLASSASSSLVSSVLSSSVSSTISSSSSVSSVSSSQSSVASSSSSVISNLYTNGIYSASVSYSVPGGTNQLTINITILNDTVTLLTNQHSPQSSESTFYINSFEGGVQGLVVGKKLDQINLSKVSAASLTPIGFNNAINQIKTLALI